jgi:phage gp36-like protein
MPRTLPAYVNPDDLTPSLPAQWVHEAADDDSDGTGETIEDICNAASDTVDAYLQGRYELPVTNAGALAKLKEAATARALFLCYQRRGKHGENNPWDAEWGRWAKKLEAIESGEVPLIIKPPAPIAPPPKVAVSQRPMKTVASGGRNAV